MATGFLEATKKDDRTDMPVQPVSNTSFYESTSPKDTALPVEEEKRPSFYEVTGGKKPLTDSIAAPSKSTKPLSYDNPLVNDYKPVGNEIYGQPETAIEKVLDPLGYPLNIVTSAAAAITDSKGDMYERIKAYTSQAANKQRRTTSSDLLKKWGYDKARPKSVFGYEVPEYANQDMDWGDVPDFLVEFGIDTAMDPLTYIPFANAIAIASRASKGLSKFGKLAKIANKQVKIANKINVDGALEKIAKEASLKKFPDAAAKAEWITRRSNEIKNFTSSKLKDQLLKQVPNIAKAQAANTLTRKIVLPMTAGTYGAIVETDENSDVLDAVKGFGIGAGAVLLGRKYDVPQNTKKVLRTLGDEAYDFYAWTTRGRLEKFSRMSDVDQIVKESARKRRYVSEDVIVRGREEALKELSPAERVAATEYIIDMEEKIIEARKLGGIEEIPGKPRQGITRKELKKSPGTYNRMRGIDEDTYKHFEEKGVPEALAVERNLQELERNGIKQWQKFNEEVIAKYNSETFQDVLALKYHFPRRYSAKDMADLADLQDEMKTLNKTFKAEPKYLKLKSRLSTRSTTLTDELVEMFKDKLSKGEKLEVMDRGKLVRIDPKADNLDTILKSKAYDTIYGEYAQGMGYAFLEDTERQAIRTMREYRESALPPIKKFESFLKGYDALNTAVKVNLLMPSITWFKNTYYDNIMKAHVETGILGAVKGFGAAFGETIDVARDLTRKISPKLGMGIDELQSGLNKDMNNILLGKEVPFSTLEGKQLSKYRVLEGTPMSILNDDTLDDVIYKPFRSAEELEELTKGGRLNDAPSGNVERLKNASIELSKKAGKWYYNDVLGKIGHAGRRLEARSRIATWKRHKELLVKNGLDDESAAQVAADLTQRAFFDYGDVTAFERSVMKRVAPFYAFYSKNFPYWLDAVTDPEKLTRIVQANRVRENVGRSPTPQERIAMPEHAKKSGARSLGKRDGEQTFAITPGMSYLDPIKLLTPLINMDAKDIPKVASEYLHPIPKTMLEHASGWDFFRNEPLQPSEMPHGKKYLGSRAGKYAKKDPNDFNLWAKAINLFGDEPVALDDRGNPYTTGNRTNTLIRMFEHPLTPVGGAPIINQIGSLYHNISQGRESTGEAVSNLVSPVRTMHVSPGSVRYQKRQHRKENTRDRKIEREKRKARRRSYYDEDEEE